MLCYTYKINNLLHGKVIFLSIILCAKFNQSRRFCKYSGDKEAKHPQNTELVTVNH